MPKSRGTLVAAYTAGQRHAICNQCDAATLGFGRGASAPDRKPGRNSFSEKLARGYTDSMETSTNGCSSRSGAPIIESGSRSVQPPFVKSRLITSIDSELSRQKNRRISDHGIVASGRHSFLSHTAEERFIEAGVMTPSS